MIETIIFTAIVIAVVVAVVVIQYEMDDHGSPWPLQPAKPHKKNEYLFSPVTEDAQPSVKGLLLCFKEHKASHKKEE